MPSPLNIKTAREIWNRFLKEYSEILPPVYNPQLFDFYQKQYSWKTYFLILTDNSVVIGLLPVVDTGRAITSVPHFSYGNIVSRQHLNDPLIVPKLRSIMKGRESGYYDIEINEIEMVRTKLRAIPTYFVRQLSITDDIEKYEKAVSLLLLPDSIDKAYGLLNTNLRRKINKSQSADWIFKIGGIELLDDFYKVYLHNISRLNSMPYGISFFRDLINTWQNSYCRFFVIYYNEIPIGSSLLIGHGNFYENAFFATNSKYNNLYISDRLHYEMIKNIYSTHDFNNGWKSPLIYSLGRSTIGSGVYKYKNHWPVANYPIITHTNLATYKKGLPAKLWSNLPFCIKRTLGPHLIKHIY